MVIASNGLPGGRVAIVTGVRGICRGRSGRGGGKITNGGDGGEGDGGGGGVAVIEGAVGAGGAAGAFKVGGVESPAGEASTAVGVDAEALRCGAGHMAA